MEAYSDSGLTTTIAADTEIPLSQKVWIKLETVGLDDKAVALVIDSCWAISSTKSTLRYDLINNK